MDFNLAQLWQRARNGREPPNKQITLRPVEVPATKATNLYLAAYAPIIDVWERGIPALMEVYRQSLDAITRDSAADVGAALTGMESEADALMIQLGIRVDDWTMDVERIHRDRWRGAVLSATGVDLGTMIGPGDMREPMRTALERNVGLISSISQESRTRIGEAVFSGLNNRETPQAVAKKVRESVAMSRKRAKLIAGDQTQKLAASLNEERHRQAGIAKYRWRHSGKLHPRLHHKARDGKIFDLGQPQGDTPGQAIHCGCLAQAYLDWDDGDEAEPPKPKKPRKKAAPEPTPEPPAKGFRSPINPAVTAESIKVVRRLTAQSRMKAQMAKAAQHEAYQDTTEFGDRVDAEIGDVTLTTAFHDKTASMLAALKPELDDLAAQIGIPELRGFKTLPKHKTHIADQGDGIMSLSPIYFNSYAEHVGRPKPDPLELERVEDARARLALDIQELQHRYQTIGEELKGVPVGDPREARLFAEQDEVWAQIGKLQNEDGKLWSQERSLSRDLLARSATASTWKTGDKPDYRPHGSWDYFADGVDQARSVLFHEFGHHVHQYLNRLGFRRLYGTPPLERDLEGFYRQAVAAGGDDRQPSNYSLKNEKEWFAENFTLYVMGRADLVDPTARELIERVFRGEYTNH